MTERGSLTPAQAADVIHWRFTGENKQFIDRGHKPKIPLGLAAVHATSHRAEHMVPPMEMPMLSSAEVAAGMHHIHETEQRAQAVADYWKSPVRDNDVSELVAHDDTRV